MNLVLAVDLFGTTVFAFSGALAAQRRQMDIFGIALVGLVTAVGGGSLRDALLGATPVFWVQRPMYILFVLLGLCAAIPAGLIQRRMKRSYYLLLVADAIGISAFTVIGAEKAMHYSTSALVLILMGTFTAVMGGVFRDIICNEIPLVLRKEIYATACIVGAAGFLALLHLGTGVGYAMLGGGLATFAIRLMAVRYSLSLPLVVIAGSQSRGGLSSK